MNLFYLFFSTLEFIILQFGLDSIYFGLNINVMETQTIRIHNSLYTLLKKIRYSPPTIMEDTADDSGVYPNKTVLHLEMLQLIFEQPIIIKITVKLRIKILIMDIFNLGTTLSFLNVTKMYCVVY